MNNPRFDWKNSYLQAEGELRRAATNNAHLRDLLRLCIPSLQRDGRQHVVVMVQAALGEIVAEGAKP